jgi:hypothetical protein
MHGRHRINMNKTTYHCIMLLTLATITSFSCGDTIWNDFWSENTFGKIICCKSKRGKSTNEWTVTLLTLKISQSNECLSIDNNTASKKESNEL